MTNHRPLWVAMQEARAFHSYPPTKASAEIRVVSDWLKARLAADAEDEGWGPAPLIELRDLEALLNAEADRAERGEGSDD